VIRECDHLADAVDVVRDHLGKADAFLTAAENLIEQPQEIDDSRDDSLGRRRNHVAHLIESAKLAVRAAAHAGEALAKRQGKA
jgi:hypothetical protein